MTHSEIETLLRPVAGGDPCGPNLEYDVQFAEFERACAGKPEQQIGDTIIKGEEPDWAVVEREASALLARTKDLRVALQLTRALIRLRGWEGFAGGLEVLLQLLTRQWAGVHPRLDADDNDPTTRLNVLAELADPATAAAVRAMPFVSSRGVGQIGLRELELANGEGQPGPDERAALSPGALENAINDVDSAALEAAARAVSSSVQAVAALDAAIAEKTGQALALGRLPALLRKASTFLTSSLERRRPTSAAAEPSGPGVFRPGGPTTGEISSREEVIRALDRIVAYYARHEPSSPIPLLIERSKKLVAMSFVDIVRELAPDGVSQVENLRGRTQ
jgi:type VI secretion system protein ImpA